MRNLKLLMLILGVQSLFAARAQGVNMTFDIDEEASSIQIDMAWVTDAFGPGLTLPAFPQTATLGAVPGSIEPGAGPFGGAGDLAHYTGFLNANVTGSTIRFKASKQAVAIDSGVWLPTDGLGPLYPDPLPDLITFPGTGLPPGGSGAYGHHVPGGPQGNFFTNISFLELALFSGELPLVGGVFPSTQSVFSWRGFMDFNSGGTFGGIAGFGTFPFSGAGGTNSAVDGSLIGTTLTVPISAEWILPIDTHGSELVLSMSGVLVAERIPEPSSAAMAIVGFTLGISWLTRRRPGALRSRGSRNPSHR